MHAKRVLSLSLATLGVIHAASLSVYAIGQAVALARGTQGKHGVKQVDRLLSNVGIPVWKLLALWVPYVLGQRTEALVALDWTDFEPDDQTTLVASLITKHGRPTPLVWMTVQKSALKGLRNEVEDAVVLRLRELIPDEVKVTVLADRGFADQKLYALLQQVDFEYVIRFRQCITVTDAQGERRTAADWVPKAGRLRKLPKARVTADRTQVGPVVCVKKKGMKEPWCLATSLEQASAAEVVTLYSRRFSIEEGFRDLKDLRFGMGLSWVRIAEPERRDRLLLLSALACALLTLLGAAGESLGMERYLKANTVKRRTYSLFRQGCMYYQAIPNMPEYRLRPLVERFAQLVCEQPVFRECFGLL
ncbi:Transposase DDE domain-containing protein [Stigmatella aurantiaca]|uniref:Transposase DDE domain-containing protein n=2 Tax=Stigmatella aurantiaca TaxID=41 RepID=A0A1H7XFH1_STIAU|nr:IS4 family transposase [Stigmatella aurantiaca]SEM32642.1 Transposase DDE domain-containing protein [Stigmatella aurantiaca]